MLSNFYTYIYLDPRKADRFIYDSICFLYEPFYVGKGKDDRAYRHITWNAIDGNKHKKNKINKIVATGTDPYILILSNDISEADAFLFEKQYISEIGRNDLKQGPLVNMTNGGEGNSGKVVSETTREKLRIAQTGKKLSPETIDKMRKALTGKKHNLSDTGRAAKRKHLMNNPKMYCRTQSSEERAAKSKRMIGKNNPFYGKKHSPEVMARMIANKRDKSGENAYWYGKTLPDDMKMALSKANPRSMPLIFLGIEYTSLTMASKATEFTRHMIKRMCESENHVDCYYKDNK